MWWIFLKSLLFSHYVRRDGVSGHTEWSHRTGQGSPSQKTETVMWEQLILCFSMMEGKCFCCDKDNFAFRIIGRDSSQEAIRETSVCVWRLFIWRNMGTARDQGQPVHKHIWKWMWCTATTLIQWPWTLWEQEGNGSQQWAWVPFLEGISYVYSWR